LIYIEIILKEMNRLKHFEDLVSITEAFPPPATRNGGTLAIRGGGPPATRGGGPRPTVTTSPPSSGGGSTSKTTNIPSAPTTSTASRFSKKPGYVKTPTTSYAGKLGTFLTKVGKKATAFTPGELSKQLTDYYNKGVFGATAAGISAAGRALSNKAKEDLEKAFFKFELPYGWPKVGDNILYIGIQKKDYRGVVEKVYKQDENHLVVMIRFPSNKNNTAEKYATAIHNITPGNEPWRSLQQEGGDWRVQLWDGGKWFKDNEETRHKGVFYWDNNLYQYVYDTDQRGKERLLVAVKVSNFVDQGGKTIQYRFNDKVKNFKDVDGDRWNTGIVVGFAEIDKENCYIVKVSA